MSVTDSPLYLSGVLRFRNEIPSISGVLKMPAGERGNCPTEEQGSGGSRERVASRALPPSPGGAGPLPPPPKQLAREGSASLQTASTGPPGVILQPQRQLLAATLNTRPGPGQPAAPGASRRRLLLGPLNFRLSDARGSGKPGARRPSPVSRPTFLNTVIVMVS